MNSKTRGPYKKTKKKMVFELPSSFFKEEHESKGLYVTWADAVIRSNGQISILYKVLGEKKQFRCPRYKTHWMDSKGLEFARLKAKKWQKENNNQTGKGNLLPLFYLDHREDFIKWLGNTAKHNTINGYESFLKMYIFPFFFEKLKIKHPRAWDEDSLSVWNSFLQDHVKSPNSRNRIRTGLRKYLKFLKSKNIIKRVPQVLNEVKRRDSREKLLPGDLPDWEAVVEWIKTLPKGRYRFLRAVMMGFGLRISEAFMVDAEDFFGAEEESNIDERNDFVREVKDKGFGKLFLYVHKAQKKKVNEDLIKFLGDQCIEPKSGPYTACCTSLELAELIVEMIENGENEEEISMDSVYKLKKEMPRDYSKYNFHLYNPHDDRRLNITLQMMDLSMDNSVEVCCMFHGQSSRQIFMRYFQWGKLQRRKQTRQIGTKLKVFK